MESLISGHLGSTSVARIVEKLGGGEFLLRFLPRKRCTPGPDTGGPKLENRRATTVLGIRRHRSSLPEHYLESISLPRQPGAGFQVGSRNDDPSIDLGRNQKGEFRLSRGDGIPSPIEAAQRLKLFLRATLTPSSHDKRAPQEALHIELSGKLLTHWYGSGEAAGLMKLVTW